MTMTDTSPTDELRAHAWTALTALAGELATLEETLEPTRRVSDLRVISETQKEQLDATVRREKSERLEALQQHGGVEATGQIVAPARMRSVDAMAAAHGALAGLERRLFRLCGICPLDTTESRPTRRIALRIRNWLHECRNAELLAAICEDADRLTDEVKRAIDGEKTTKLQAPCPYCGRTSLVVYHEQGFIRCDKPRWADCLCGTEGCPCTRGRRHKWVRERGQWDILARMLERKSS